MNLSIEELRKHLMSLPAGDRVELAYELLESVSEDELDDGSAEGEVAWADEIKRRVDEYDAGLVKALPGEEVFARARALVRTVEQQRSQLR